MSDSAQEVRGKVVSSKLRTMLNASGATARDGTLELQTGSLQKMTATFGATALAKIQGKVFFDNEAMDRLQLLYNISDHKMRIIGNLLRTYCGCGSLVKHEAYMYERNKMLADLFTCDTFPQTIYVDADDDAGIHAEDNSGKKRRKKPKKTTIVMKQI